MSLRRLMHSIMLAVALAATPSLAHAHLTNTGLGPFYDGLTHLFVTPEDLLAVVALSLLAGLRGPRFGRVVLFALPVACLAGTISGLLITLHLTLPIATAIVTIALGALVAADRPLPLPLVAGLTIVFGLLDGGVSGVEIVRARSIGLGIVGFVAAPFAVIAVGAGNVTSVRAWWARVAVRVAGSWIAAIGLFMLGWSLRTP